MSTVFPYLKVRRLMALTQSEYLTLLTHAPADSVRAFAETLIPQLGDIQVIKNRTGLIMLPYTDSAGGATFHLGEVLVSEAQVQIGGGAQGYGLVTGRDLALAVGIALIDAAVQAGIEADSITAFLIDQQTAQRAADDHLLQQVEATRVEMETF